MLVFPHQPVHYLCLHLKPAHFLFISEELHGGSCVHVGVLDVGYYELGGLRFGDADQAMANDSQCDAIEIGGHAAPGLLVTGSALFLISQGLLQCRRVTGDIHL
jgi:hypothetical protein